MAARKPRLKATHQVPSGLGGAFDVAILSEDGDYSFVRVVMPGAGDWHGYTFKAKTAQLTPLRAPQGDA
jgi:hypothetical protein